MSSWGAANDCHPEERFARDCHPEERFARDCHPEERSDERISSNVREILRFAQDDK
jgi:hypothetical protein